MGSYLRPVEMAEALAALAAGPRAVLAGGTDFYPARVGRPLDDDVLDITALDSLRGIRDDDRAWRIPALVTWSELIAADLPACFDGLKLAAREVGGVQIQNAGTICGNVCNASPAADGIPCLLTLEAEVELASLRGRRCVPVSTFVQGNRRTSRAADELVTALLVPKPAPDARSTFLKLGARKYLVISIVMTAGLIEVDASARITKARLAVGACSAAAQRLPALEAELVGAKLDPAIVHRVRAEHLAPLSPIDYVRATAEYRREAALTLVQRTLATLAGGAS